MRYFPILRGKQNELMALRKLATNIAENGKVIPIIEPVKLNNPTLISFNEFKKKSMPFLFICNPIYGEFSHNTRELSNSIINPILKDYDNWVPALYVDEGTTPREFDAFTNEYDGYDLALVYYGKPQQSIDSDAADIKHHVFVSRWIEDSYIQSISKGKRVIIKDNFRRRARNADYPDYREFFTNENTLAGNKRNVDFGDFSIVGDYFMEKGGAAHAAALHHVHFAENSHSLYISHFISDRTKTAADLQGKIIEAVDHLVESLDDLQPNNTQTCDEYRMMSQTEKSSTLAYMKQLAIKHHLEVMLDGGLEG